MWVKRLVFIVPKLETMDHFVKMSFPIIKYSHEQQPWINYVNWDIRIN